MFLTQLTTNIFLFIIGLLGIVLNRRNILIILMCVELVLLSLNLNFIIFSVYLDYL
jgi:NADH:ubiquinone oxidoreductase subunit K